MVVAVTGGIGSGKSAVCDMLAALGVPIIDADIAAREVVAPGTVGLHRVVEAFGPLVLDPDGRLDRGRLKRIVFSKDTDRKRLEMILHPLIRERMDTQLAQVDAPYCVMCIPLLTADSDYRMIDRVLVVDCPYELQLSRVMRRDDLTADEVKAIIGTQSGREKRLQFADDVVVNDDDLAMLRRQVTDLHNRYLEIATAAVAKDC